MTVQDVPNNENEAMGFSYCGLDDMSHSHACCTLYVQSSRRHFLGMPSTISMDYSAYRAGTCTKYLFHESE